MMTNREGCWEKRILSEIEGEGEDMVPISLYVKLMSKRSKITQARPTAPSRAHHYKQLEVVLIR